MGSPQTMASPTPTQRIEQPMTIYLRALIKDYGLKHEVAQPFKFPGGELHLKNIAENVLSVKAWIADVRGAQSDELITAALLANVAHQRQTPFILMLPYLPAARADRGEPLGARVYADIVKSMNPQQIIGIDPHSTYITNYYEDILPGKLTTLNPYPLLQRALKDAGHENRYNAVIAPDKGAVPRASTVAKALGIDLYQATKHRDFDTGQILGIEMTETLPESGNYLIFDDICDGGGTFIGLANATGLHHTQLGLWVTHGIFSGKAPDLRRYYRHIYTTDSHPGHSRPGVATVVVPTETYMLQNLKEF